MEILWTGWASLLKGDFALRGVSYLWMFPIYGSGVFLEPLHDRLRELHWFLRGLLWIIVIFTIEFVSGAFIKMSVGVIPWDYTGASALSIGGFIRLDYAPAWFIVGLLYEKIHDFLRNKISS